MVNSEGYLLFFLFFNTQWWFLFLQKKGILCLCAQLPIAEQLPFIPICCMPFPPGKKNLRMIVATHSLKSTHIFKQRNKQKIDPVNTNLCSIPMSLISCRKLHVWSVSYGDENQRRCRKCPKRYFSVIYSFSYSKCNACMIC